MIQRIFSPIAVLAILAMVVSLTGCQSSPSAATPQQTATVTRGSLTALVNVAGAITARSQVNLTFRIAGRIKEIQAQTGDRVKAGQALARLDTTELELAVAQEQASLDSARIELADTQDGPELADIAAARASVASAQAAYQAALTKYNLMDAQTTQARAKLDKAAAKLARKQAAYSWHANDWLDPKPKDSRQKDELDDAQTEYDLVLAAYNQTAAGINDSALKAAAAELAEAQYTLDDLLNTPTPEALAVAQARVRQAEASLQLAQTRLAQGTLVAPFDGTVAHVYAQVGERVTPNTQIMVLADLSQLELSASLAEADMPKVRVGQAALITLDAIAGVTFHGRVDDLDLAGFTTQGVVNYAMTVVLSDTTQAVQPGMKGDADIILDQRNDVLLIPNRAVRTVGQQRVATVVYKGQRIDTPITLGLAGEKQTEVLAGLSEGDIVLVGSTKTTTSNSK